ncbi:MAG: RHS repeat domain-containing protein [Draconibacterium sp.]
MNTSTTVVAEYSFDAWGRRRQAAHWDNYDLSAEPELFAGRGFTGHEHLPWFGLINANGRLYDPAVGRFLSPDNYVQMPDFSQNFNRYSYCLNNPLVYVDPSGEIAWFVPIIIGAVVGGTSGAVMAGKAGAQGFWEWAGYIGGGALIGGMSGGAASGVSALGGGAMLAGAAAGAVGGSGFSGMATGWNGQAMLNGALIGAAAGFIGGGVASAIGGPGGAFAGGFASDVTSQFLGTGDVSFGRSLLAGGISFGIYHGMQYMQYRAMGGKLGQMDVTYRQYSKINTAYQRSSFWKKEHGVILNRDGSARFAPRADRNKFDVTLRIP